ncbi:rod shape-determining protein MreC [Cohnella herbarum]|uniref:Cell shape-determining protein MreC n=1 Tax=Cohnella herbarum TaxID=2728023 RepID=A0A7Z2VEX7_9BACL|nr:rod shape-determining protein MreC [Cohnella herbarum]QJD81796.1 rod shape-determining protein MreC [Cohnella herbarum]
MSGIFRLLRNKRLFILMIGLIVFIALMGFTLGRNRLTWPEKFLNDAFGITQGTLYQPVGAVADFFRDLGRLSDVYKENEQFRQTVAQYTQDQIKFNLLEAENKRLKEDLNFTEQQKNMDNYRYLIAQVVGTNSNPYEKTITINLGSKDGIKPEMAVRTVEGLVGMVSKVKNFTSTVTLITNLDPNSSRGTPVSATFLGKPDSFGILEYDDETKNLQMTKIDENDKPADGDKVITSGVGSLFPKGIIIGTVESSQVGDFGLTYTAIIKPATNFDHLREVFVVVVPEVEEP